MLLLRRASGGGSLLISSDIAHAIEMAHEGIPLVVIQRQLGHANLGITSIYLQGIDSSEIIDTVHARPAPTIRATAGLSRR
jgi:integrase